MTHRDEMATTRVKFDDPSLHANVHYRVMNGNHRQRASRGSLVDRGANGGILGNDVRITQQHPRTVDVTGIDNHQLQNLKLCDAVGKTMSQKGPVIVVLRNYAYYGMHRSLHSSGQIEYFKNQVDDRSYVVGGNQCIRTNDGHVLPLDITNDIGTVVDFILEILNLSR